MDIQDVKVGMQIAYVPRVAEGKLDHYLTEFGFVTGIAKTKEIVWCRFWHKGESGIQLRTTAISEGVFVEFLVPHESTEQSTVVGLLKVLYPQMWLAEYSCPLCGNTFGMLCQHDF